MLSHLISPLQQIATVYPLFWVASVGLIAFIEGQTIKDAWGTVSPVTGVGNLKEEYYPGDLGFDPLGEKLSPGMRGACCLVRHSPLVRHRARTPQVLLQHTSNMFFSFFFLNIRPRKVSDFFFSVRFPFASGRLALTEGLAPKDGEDFRLIQSQELDLGRYAMIGVLGMVAQECIDGQGILEHVISRV